MDAHLELHVLKVGGVLDLGTHQVRAKDDAQGGRLHLVGAAVGSDAATCAPHVDAIRTLPDRTPGSWCQASSESRAVGVMAAAAVPTQMHKQVL